MVTWKIGTTIQILLEFDDDEFEVVSSSTSFLAKVKHSSGQEYEFDQETDEASKTISLTADTAAWQLGMYRSDIRVELTDKTVYVPADNFIEFKLIKPVTEEQETA